jgi:two-component system, LytTR family, sensor kinase
LIANLADFLRYNLERNNDLIDIQEELQQVRDYVAIEQARFGDKLEVTFDVDDVHPTIPCLLIQPLVENAIQHGIQPSRQPGKVNISVKRDAERFKITIQNTGIGISQNAIDKLYNGTMESHHIGLMNVHQRISLLYGEGLYIKRLEQGTEVVFYVNELK